MNSWLIYLAEVSFCLGLGFAAYWVFFRKLTHFRLNRFFLLGILLFSLIIPALHISIAVESEAVKAWQPAWLGQIAETSTETNFSQETPVLLSPQTEVVTSQKASPPINWWKVAAGAWILGFALQSFKTGFRLVRLLRFLRRHKKGKLPPDHPWLKKAGSFSFFSFVHLHPDLPGGPWAELVQRHEQAHSRQLHSLDLLLLEGVSLLLWFHPFIRFIRSEMKVVHEYLADAEVVHTLDPVTYSKMILQLATTGQNLPFAHGFARSDAGKRIIMLNQKRSSKMSRYKYLFLLPLIALLGFAFSVESHTVAPEIKISVTPEKTVAFAGEAVPIENPRVQEKLSESMIRLQYDKATCLLLHQRAARWAPVILPELQSAGLPDDFFYLAMAESHLSNEAKSPSGASGMWQFMPATGDAFGLLRNKTIDQRRDPVLATRAACSYLKSAHEKLGSYTAAAASYNMGVPGLQKAMDAQQVENYFDLWLNPETNAYVYRVLVMKALMEKPALFGIDRGEVTPATPWKFREVTVNHSIPDLAGWAKSQGTNYAELRNLNPFLIDRNYELDLPKGASIQIRLPLSSNRPKGNPSGYPLKGTPEVSSGYGMRKSPLDGKKKLHSGVDFRAAAGTEVFATAPGVVKVSAYDEKFGHHLRIDHGNGLETFFAHLSERMVEEGESVGLQSLIGKVGSSGLSTGPHLHYEVWKNGEATDPAPYLN